MPVYDLKPETSVQGVAEQAASIVNRKEYNSVAIPRRQDTVNAFPIPDTFFVLGVYPNARSRFLLFMHPIGPIGFGSSTCLITVAGCTVLFMIHRLICTYREITMCFYNYPNPSSSSSRHPVPFGVLKKHPTAVLPPPTSLFYYILLHRTARIANHLMTCRYTGWHTAISATGRGVRAGDVLPAAGRRCSVGRCHAYFRCGAADFDSGVRMCGTRRCGTGGACFLPLRLLTADIRVSCLQALPNPRVCLCPPLRYPFRCIADMPFTFISSVVRFPILPTLFLYICLRFFPPSFPPLLLGAYDRPYSDGDTSTDGGAARGTIWVGYKTTALE
jgi:hypothetical protein